MHAEKAHIPPTAVLDGTTQSRRFITRNSFRIRDFETVGRQGLVLLLCAAALAIVQVHAIAEVDAPVRPEGWTPHPAQLTVTNNLTGDRKELSVETGEWKVVFSLFFNGGICRLFDKVNDPHERELLVNGPDYSQGGIFDYDVYLRFDQEHMTTMGRNSEPKHASLEILESSPARLRLRQICRPRLNNGQGPPNDPFPELDMVTATTDWTFYPNGRVNIKFDAVRSADWYDAVGRGPGGSGPGINADGAVLTATNGASFLAPWATQGDMIESPSGKWGPIEVVERLGAKTLRLETNVPAGTNLDFVIRRSNILDETISIHADGVRGEPPRRSTWQGGSNGDPLFHNALNHDDGLFRSGRVPLSNDYLLVHWTRPPRGYGSLLAFWQPFGAASYAVFNDVTYENISYTQVGWRGWRPFQEHHWYFMAQLGTENAPVLPRIKSVADALPFADDYRHPYAEARAGKLREGDGIAKCGYNLATGAYEITANESGTAEIAFDPARGGSVKEPLAYWQPAVVVANLRPGKEKLRVELSQDNGATFQPLPESWYNLAPDGVPARVQGGPKETLVQLLCPVPASATGPSRWVLRLSRSGRN